MEAPTAAATVPTAAATVPTAAATVPTAAWTGAGASYERECQQNSNRDDATPRDQSSCSHGGISHSAEPTQMPGHAGSAIAVSAPFRAFRSKFDDLPLSTSAPQFERNAAG
jgi:hypothetical protein